MRERLATAKANRPPEAFTEPLLSFIAKSTPGYDAPHHLAPYIGVLENAIGTSQRVVFAAPPQHGKTTATVAALIWWLLRHPELSFVYATYSQERAYQVSRIASFVAANAGLQLATETLGLWRTPQGGQILWTSLGGKLTGNPGGGVVVVDDPVSGPKDANSPTMRETLRAWFDQNVFTRRHMGTSYIVMATRWHQDDLSGTLVKSGDFRYINLKAIADEDRPPGDNRAIGEALWPEKRPLVGFLDESQRRNPWAFSAMFQGMPTPRGNALFREPAYWTELPTSGFRVSYGVDLAYKGKTRNDWSVCVEIWAVPPPPMPQLKRGETQPVTYLDWRFYIVDVIRKQVEAPMFTLSLKAKHTSRRGNFSMYGASVEDGSAQFFRAKGIPLRVMDCGGRDKFQRAQITSEIWNAGYIMVPADSAEYPWVDVYVDELMSFTGSDKEVDDQTDGTVSGIDAALRGSDSSVLGFGDVVR